MCVCVCVCACVHFGSISSLIQISLNIIDIYCLHIFFLILSYCRFDFIVFSIVSYSIQKLHHFCYTSSLDDGPKSGRKYFGNKQIWKIYQSIHAEYNKINTAI